LEIKVSNKINNEEMLQLVYAVSTLSVEDRAYLASLILSTIIPTDAVKRLAEFMVKLSEINVDPHESDDE